MTEQLVVYSPEEVKKYKERILDHLEMSIERLRQILEQESALKVFQTMKYDKAVLEPLSGKPENLIEAVNQSQTYLVSIKAVEYLYEKFPDQTFVINWGNIPGYDIESKDGSIIAECFAATSYKSNGKLTKDLKRLAANESAVFKYEFFYDKEFTEDHRLYYQEKYSDVEIVKFYDDLG